jgi:type VI secretion system secreted protein VgrG
MAIRIEVKIGTLTLRDREIERLEIEQALGDHHRLSLTFHRDPSKPLKLADFVSPPVTVTLTDDATKKTAQAFAGVTVSCEEQHQLQGGSFFVLTALSPSERFSRRHGVSRFADSSFGDIITRFNGVTVGAAPKVQRTSNYVQSGEDDLAFLLRFADDFQCFIRPKDKGLEIRHGFDDKRHALTFGKNLQAITSRIAALNPREKDAFYEFGKKEEVLLRDKTQNAPMSGAAKLTDAVKQGAPALNGGKDPNILESTARATTIGEFRDLLLRESERVLGAAVTVDGVSTNIELLIGDTVDIQAGSNFKLDNPPGTLGLVKVTHLFDGQQYTNTFTATPWMNFNNALQPPRRVLTGLVTAEVTSNEDPLNAGRIRVREVGINRDDEEAHFFARLLTPFAGNGRGIAFLPEIGDEVVLGFEEGDPERPYVVGSVWNGKDLCPGPKPKRIVTKSGNQIVMDDAGAIEIFTPGGTCMVQLSNGIDGTPRVTIHAEGDLFLEAKERIQLKCKELVALVDKDVTRIIGGDDQTSVQGIRTSSIAGADSLASSDSITLLVGGSSVELAATGTTIQGLNVSSVAKVQNVVSGLMVQLNPPGFVVPPAQGSSILQPAKKDSSWGGRANPKPTELIKVSREDGPTS